MEIDCPGRMPQRMFLAELGTSGHEFLVEGFVV